MAPGVCVTSFRMFMRRSDLARFNRLLRPAPTRARAVVNIWSITGRNYCTHKSTYSEDSTGKANSTKKSSPSKRSSNKHTPDIENASTASFSMPAETQIQDTASTIDLSAMTVAALKAQLKAHGLSVSGKKEVLVERLHAFRRRQAQQNPTDAQEEPPPAPLASTALVPTSAPTAACYVLETITDDWDWCNKYDPPKDSLNDAVVVEYIQGLPHVTVPLPSRNEKCRFALKPVSHRVGDFCEMLKTEDRGIDHVTVLNNSGVRIASTCNIESLMDEPFWLQINNQKYKVVPPQREKIQIGDLSKLGDIRALVAQLYEALHVGEFHLKKEEEMASKLEELRYQIAPMERQKMELSAQAERKTSMMTWIGLGLMSMQFGILARLTWWEYSWDIMEPVTYFVTYGTAMAMYAYYCITKQEYNLPDVRDRQYLLTIHKSAKKKNFDVDTYNKLKREIAEIEYDLRRLRDPINLQLPPHIDRAQRGPAAAPSLQALTSQITLTSKTKGGFRLPFLDPKNTSSSSSSSQ